MRAASSSSVKLFGLAGNTDKAMPAQIHFRIAALSQKRDQPIIAKLLSYVICHRLSLLRGDWRKFKAERFCYSRGLDNACQVCSLAGIREAITTDVDLAFYVADMTHYLIKS
jgi:hypothetical protein